MSLMLIDTQTVQQPLQLAATDRARDLFLFVRPAKTALLQPTVEEPEAVVIPAQYLQLVASLVAKDKEAVRERVEFERILHDRRESVDGFAHVGGAAGKIYLSRSEGINPRVESLVVGRQHAFGSNAETTARNRSGLNPGAISIDAKPTRTVNTASTETHASDNGEGETDTGSQSKDFETG